MLTLLVSFAAVVRYGGRTDSADNLDAGPDAKAGGPGPLPPPQIFGKKGRKRRKDSIKKIF